MALPFERWQAVAEALAMEINEFLPPEASAEIDALVDSVGFEVSAKSNGAACAALLIIIAGLCETMQTILPKPTMQ